MKFLRFVILGIVLSLGLAVLFSQFHPVQEANAETSLIRQPLWSVNLRTWRPIIATETQVFVAVERKKGQEVDFQASSLQALDATSGKVQWVSPVPVIRILGVEDKTLYATTKEGVVALDSTTGKPKTTIKVPRSRTTTQDDSVIGIFKGIAIGEYTDVAGKRDIINPVFRSEITARNANKLLWKFEPPLGTLIGVTGAQPTIQEDILFLPLLLTQPKRAYQFKGLDPATGKVLWTWQAPTDLWIAPLFGDTVYPSVYGDSQENKKPWLKALDLKTGKERWSVELRGMVQAANDREVFVLAGKDRHFVVLDKQTGQRLREFDLELDSQGNFRPFLAGNLIYNLNETYKNIVPGFYASADTDSWITASDVNTGKVIWQTPSIANSFLAFEATGERLYLSVSAKNPKEGKNSIQAFETQIP